MDFDVHAVRPRLPGQRRRADRADSAGRAAARRTARADRQHHERRRERRLSGLGTVRRQQGGAGTADAHAGHGAPRARRVRPSSSIRATCGRACIRRRFLHEDISDRPLPEVTVPFWNWLLDQHPADSAASDSRRSRRTRDGCSRRDRDFDLPPSSKPPNRRRRADCARRGPAARLAIRAATRSSTPASATCRAGSRRRSARRQHQRHAERRAAGAMWRRRGSFELHLSTRLPGGFWSVEVRQRGAARRCPCRDARGGTTSRACRRTAEPRCSRRIRSIDVASASPSRLWMAALQLPGDVVAYLDRIRRADSIRLRDATRGRRAMYQTVFATEPGSAEMPSAGRPSRPNS